jgi:two-component system, OmpR family, sensor kinase
MKFHTKVFLWYAGLLTLIIIGFSIAVFGVIQATVVNSIDDRLAHKTYHLIDNMSILSDTSGIEIIFQDHDIFRVAGISIQVWQTHDGNTEIPPVLVHSSVDLSVVTTALDDSKLMLDEQIYTDIVFHAERQRVMTHPFMTDEGRQIGVIQTASSIMIVDQIIEGIFKAMIITTIMGWVISMCLDMLLSYHALQPIQKITTAVANISTSNDLTTRLTDTGLDHEVGRLTKGFNHMMERLERLFGVQQRFITELSHELRTPLTTIQGNIDIIERYGSDEASIQAIQIETKRMTRMVTEVITLARADVGGIAIGLYPLDINHNLITDCYSRIAAMTNLQTDTMNITLNKHNKPVIINGDYEYLQQAVHNLLMNAIRFTPAGGAIDVSICQDADYGIIEVTDTGIGIKKESFERIFERFYRADDARTHTSDHDGVGLGLSIAKWIIEAHHGIIEIESEVNVGTTMRVKLPLFKDTHPTTLK